MRGKHGSHVNGPRHHRWNNGPLIASNGYVKIRVGKDHHLADPNGYAYEHRLVAEKMLGRRLDRGEIVHHRNGDKTDNREANLEITTRGDHNRHHNAVDRGRGEDGRFTPLDVDGGLT